MKLDNMLKERIEYSKKLCKQEKITGEILPIP